MNSAWSQGVSISRFGRVVMVRGCIGKEDYVRYMLMITDDGPGPVESREGTLLLRPPADGVTVRVRDGRLLRTGGAFAETKEHVAGIELVECADLDEAIAIASTHPAAGRHPIEIRPFWPFEED